MKLAYTFMLLAVCVTTTVAVEDEKLPLRRLQQHIPEKFEISQDNNEKNEWNDANTASPSQNLMNSRRQNAEKEQLSDQELFTRLLRSDSKLSLSMPSAPPPVVVPTPPTPTIVTPTIPGPFCVDFECGDGYLLRENANTRPGIDRETCCYREGVCNGAPVGSACSLGDIVNSLIPNPSFEEFTGCPVTFSQLNLAKDWVQATGGTSDYWIGAPTCNDNWRVGLGGIGALKQIATDGNAFVGSIKEEEDYYEYIGACLNSPLKAGVEYTFTLDIAAATDDSSFGGDTNGATDLLCIPDCDLFQIEGQDYKGDEYEILATAEPAGGISGGGDWKPLTFVAKPTSDCPAIMFGPSISQTIQSGQFGTYVIYDFLNLQEGAAGVCNAKGECVPAS